METDERTQGRARLDEAVYGVDLCGRDYENVFLSSEQTLSHSFLNGTSFRNSVFLHAPMNEAELAEAELVECEFEGVDFSGTSFIGAKIEDCTFASCNFANGEWRHSYFVGVSFTNCDFNYTTINLCRFDRCTFTGQGAKHIDNRSVNYNTFLRTFFDFTIEDDVVLASNLGLPATGQRRAVANYGSGITLETICLKGSPEQLVISEFVSAVENELSTAPRGRLRALRLEFISNIIRGLSVLSRISATTLAYLEGLFLSVAKRAQTEDRALTAMSVLLNIRSLLFDYSAPPESEYARYNCRAINIFFERTYDRNAAKRLAAILGTLASGEPAAFRVSRFANGSTTIYMVAAEITTVGVALAALKFALRQANLALVEARKIRTNAAKLARPKAVKSPSRTRRKSRVPALHGHDSRARDVAALHAVAATYGRLAVELDDKASVTIYFESSK